MRKLVLWGMILAGPISVLTAQESPEQFLGFPVGADRELVDWQQVTGYFDQLGQHSERVVVEELGRTTQNRAFLLVTISSTENLLQLERYRQIQESLADPRRIEGVPERLLEEGKTIVLVTCSIHSTEVASTQMSMELAYDLAVSEDQQTAEILRDVILFLVPSVNPDGVDIVNRWYRQTLGTPAEGKAPPWLYHPYTGHDNNRDWFMFTQKETRLVVQKVHNVWHPQIVADVHQMGRYGARMFVPPYMDPIDPNVDPILQAGIVNLGGTLFSALLTAGKQGVVTNAIYDAYAPARAYQHYHGGVRILLEAAQTELATPVEIQPGELTSGKNYDVHTPSWNYPVPWKGGSWRQRDIIDYEKIGLRAALLHAARYRKSWLRNFYQVGRNAIERSRPYAFVVPSGQLDLQSVSDLLGVLEFGSVEIHVASESFTTDSSTWVSPPFGEEGRREFAAGSWVVLMQQPYSSFAKTMLEIQNYPTIREQGNGRLRKPYDITAQTLGIEMGVEVYQIDEPFDAHLKRVQNVAASSGRLEGEGDHWLFSHSNNAFARLTNRLLKADSRVYWAPNGFRVRGREFPAGTLSAKVSKSKTEIDELLEGIPVSVWRVRRRPQLAWQRIRLPRVGLYQGYTASIDEGWTRWILERFGFTYHSLSDQEIQQRRLSHYDIIVIPHQDPAELVQGLKEPYPELYQGGLGEKGLSRLKDFAESGGTLLFLGGSAQVPLSHWETEVENMTQNLSAEEFYVPGSFLRVQVNNRHPIGYGMPAEAAILFNNDPVFRLNRGLRLVRYGSENLLLSGWMTGEKHLADRTALAEFPIGKGRVILIGFRTQFRAQARGTYKFLFNSLYYATTK